VILGAKAQFAKATIVADLSGALVRARPPLFGAAKLADFFAAYQNAFGRAFPADLLPESSLCVVGDRGGRRFAQEEASRLREPELPPRRVERVQLMIGTARGPKYWHGKFSRGNFMRDCPMGYFLAGFDRNRMGLLRFYYMRRDAWSRVLFRLPCRGASPHESKNAASVPDFLDAFAAFSRNLQPRVSALVACEKSNDPLGSLYEITMADGGTHRSNESQIYDPNFAELAARFFGEAPQPL
jgi:hypothetical protein